MSWTDSNKKYAAWACGILIILIVISVIKYRTAKPNVTDEAAVNAAYSVKTTRATIGSIDKTLNGQGTLGAVQGGITRVASVNPGRIIAVSVREGDQVAAGQVLALINASVQIAQTQSNAAALNAAVSQAKQATLEAQASATEQQNSVKIARLDLETSRSELSRLKKGARPQEIAQAEQAIKQAQANYDRAKTEVDRVKFLYDKGIMAKRDYDDTVTALKVDEAALESAKQQASLVRSGPTQEEIHQAALKVDSAQANLTQAERGVVMVDAKNQAARAAADTVTQKQADLAASRSTASEYQLRSPISGTVTKRNQNPGDVADPTTPVVEISDSHQLDLIAQITAEAGWSVKPGMPAQISITGAPGRTFQGRVINTGTVDPQSGLLGVRIAVLNPDANLKAGEYGSADIILRTDTNMTLVPKESVIDREGKQVVFVVGPDNIAHQRNVTVGVENQRMVEILTGLKPGEQVILVGQYELSDGAKVKPTGN